MRWEGNRQSDNVEDRRGSGGGGFGGGMGPRIGGRGIGIGTIVIALVGGWILGINPLTLLSALSGGGGMPDSAVVQQAPAQRPPADDRMAAFVSTVLADTEDVWKQQFSQMGGSYRDPKLVLFRGATPTACGTGQTAMGPFYCPGDQKVYIDLAFYDTMRTQLGAPGDFAPPDPLGDISRQNRVAGFRAPFRGFQPTASAGSLRTGSHRDLRPWQR